MNRITRRALLQVGLGSLAGAGVFGRFGLLNAATQPAGDYRALVCVFLFGGNDSNNMVVPMDAASFNAYTSIRRTLAISGSSLLQAQSSSKNVYGFHPSLPEVQKLFQAGKLAVIANTGTLVQPITRNQYLANQSLAPSNLFSHADQQMQWQTTVSKGSSSTGWSGRLADALAPLNRSSSLPAFVSVAGNAAQGSGDQTRPATIAPGAALGLQGFDTTAPSVARMSALQELITLDSGMTLVQQANQRLRQGVSDSAVLSKALAGAPALTTTFPNTSLGSQLQQVAKLLQVRDSISAGRQIFFCSLGGFDTHSNQLNDQASLFAQLSAALNAFYSATEELNVANQVVTFTESDFSRTFMPNSNGGTDHAWGSHHLVMGGAVRGNQTYGSFPEFAIGGPDDAGNGRWIPGISVDQYGATLAQWFGAAPEQLPAIFPNLQSFGLKNLGFV
jgi:uncharacterized protein (DUF1501 family)